MPAKNRIKTYVPEAYYHVYNRGVEKRGIFLDYPVFVRKFICGQINLKEIYFEFEAQIKKFLETGLKPTHIDSHKHVHLVPKIFGILLELGQKYGITRMRLSRESFINCITLPISPRAMGVMGLSIVANLHLRRIKINRIAIADYCYGLTESGSLNERRLIKILSCLRAGTNELICHPGVTTDYLVKRYRWNYKWSMELDALTNERIRFLVDNLNIQLIRYDEI